MRPSRILALLSVATALSACSGGNVKTASDYSAPAAPPVRHSTYSPYATYGTANATWVPPAADRRGTIVRPTDPAILSGRPDYEHAPWATGAAGGEQFAPPGTF